MLLKSFATHWWLTILFQLTVCNPNFYNSLQLTVGSSTLLQPTATHHESVTVLDQRTPRFLHWSILLQLTICHWNFYNPLQLTVCISKLSPFPLIYTKTFTQRPKSHLLKLLNLCMDINSICVQNIGGATCTHYCNQ